MRVSVEPSYLTRLGLVYGHPIRLKIVTELYRREMSPSQFHEEFGGAAKNVVHWHFKQLREHGWIRKVKTAKSASGRGRPQHLYRATELAVVGCDTWAELPLSIRSAFSMRTLEQLNEQFQIAIHANTFDSRSDRHLTWTPVLLDAEKVAGLLREMTSCFWSLFQEQADAKVRLAESGEKPILMTVVLAGFESPLSPSAPDEQTIRLANAAAPAEGETESDLPWLMKLAKVFVDPLNLKIISELNLREMSPSQLAAAFDSPSVFAIDRRCKMLTEMGWLQKVGEKTGGERRGATENFYLAVSPAVFELDQWSTISSSAKGRATGVTLDQFWERVIEAVDAGTFDARVDRHLSWSPLLLDQQGWNQVTSLLYRYFEKVLAIQKEGQSPAPGPGSVAATFFVAGFESPEPASTVHLKTF